MSLAPDLSSVEQITAQKLLEAEGTEIPELLREAREYVSFYNWCDGIHEQYIGAFFEGILGLFLFRIKPSRKDVDEWVWVICGDLPPAYLSSEDCIDPVSALSGYIQEMSRWVLAAAEGSSVAALIPVNVPATRANSEMLGSRLELLKTEVLPALRRMASLKRRLGPESTDNTKN